MNTPVDVETSPPQKASDGKPYAHDGDGRGFLFLQSLSIGARVIIGFCFVLFILIAIVFLSNINTASFSRAFDDQLFQTNEAQDIFQIDKKISELQKYLLIYSHTGQGGALRRAKVIDNTIIDELSVISARYQSRSRRSTNESRAKFYSEKLELVKKMEAIVRNYPDKITELASERTRSVELVEKDLSRSAEAIEAQISRVRQLELTRANKRSLQLVVDLERGFIKQHRQILVFFYNRDFSLLDEIKAGFVVLNSQLLDLREILTNSKQAVSVAEIIDAYDSHEDIFYQAVQANRGYLYLVNVVLAGETAEFLSLSESLRTLTLEQLITNAQESREGIDRTQSIANIASVVAITIGLILAFVIGASITLPIRGITLAVSQLAKGNSRTQIPGLKRGDEIGQIARAADVFKNMNARTKTLLAETQRLADSIRLREQMLRGKTAELEKSNEDLDNFAYVASHDLKSPLRGIDNLASWIEEDCRDILPADSSAHLKTLRKRIERMENLLSDLLRYSRAGRVADKVEEVDLQSLVNNVFELLDRPESCDLQIREKLPTLLTQKTPIQQVFLNLFTNAIKYSDKACPRIEVAVTNYCDQYYEFMVADDGPGIEPDYHEKIFKMFQTLQARDIIEGSGMGLAIIKRVIEGVGGVIRVKSSPGQGAAFYFTWPKSMLIDDSLP